VLLSRTGVVLSDKNTCGEVNPSSIEAERRLAMQIGYLRDQGRPAPDTDQQQNTPFGYTFVRGIFLHNSLNHLTSNDVCSFSEIWRLFGNAILYCTPFHKRSTWLAARQRSNKEAGRVPASAIGIRSFNNPSRRGCGKHVPRWNRGVGRRATVQVTVALRGSGKIFPRQ
jgi:hypothetical protein